MISAITASGGKTPIDPFGLLDERGGDEGPRLPYDPAILQAIQDSGKFG
jgi:hypothetical protein